MSQFSKNNLKAVLLALSVDTKKPIGKRPSLLEIDLWRQKKLSQKRSTEVKSYIACDAECYQNWLDLLSSEEQLKAEIKPTSKSTWNKLKTFLHFDTPLWISSGVTIALFIAVFGLKSFLSPNIVQGIDDSYTQFDSYPPISAWHYQSSSKGSRFPSSILIPYKQATKAILVGIGAGLRTLQTSGYLTAQWQPVISEYPTNLPTCQNSISVKHCDEQNKQLSEFGRWLVLMQLHCSQNQSNDKDFYSVQRERLEYFNYQFSTFPTLEPLSTQLQNFKHSNKQLCTTTKILMDTFDN